MGNRVVVRRRRAAGNHFLQHRITTGVSLLGVTELVTAETAEASWLGCSRKHWLLAPAGTFNAVIEQCHCELSYHEKIFGLVAWAKLGHKLILRRWEGHWCRWTCSEGVQNRGVKEPSCVPCESPLNRCWEWTSLLKVFVHSISLAACGQYWTAQPKLELLVCGRCWGVRLYCSVT